MEFKGVEIPEGIRGKLLHLKLDYDYSGRERRFPTGIPADILRVIDKLQKKAEARLFDFIGFYDSESRQQRDTRGWALIREYKHPGTAFLFAEDPIGPDTVVVMRSYAKYKGQQEDFHIDTAYYWISPERSPRNQLPFVYVLRSLKDKSGEDRLRVDAIVWAEADSERAREFANKFFACSFAGPLEGIERFRREFEIWKQGKTLQEPERKSVKRRVRSSVLEPVPELY